MAFKEALKKFPILGLPPSYNAFLIQLFLHMRMGIDMAEKNAYQNKVGTIGHHAHCRASGGMAIFLGFSAAR